MMFQVTISGPDLSSSGLMIQRTRNRALSELPGCSCLGSPKHRYPRIMTTPRGLPSLGHAQPTWQQFMHQTLLSTERPEAGDVLPGRGQVRKTRCLDNLNFPKPG